MYMIYFPKYYQIKLIKSYNYFDPKMILINLFKKIMVSIFTNKCISYQNVQTFQTTSLEWP